MRLLHRVRRDEWTRSIAVIGLMLLPLAACDDAEELVETVGANEVFQFDYAYASNNGQNDVYVVQRGSGGSCANPTSANLTLAQLADLVQSQNTSYGLHACTTQFRVAGTDVEQVRNTGTLFGVETTGGQNITVYGNGPGTTDAQRPSGIVITTSGGVTVGQPTTVASAEVSFGTQGNVWSCADGGPVWADNANGAGATFFEITLTQRDDATKRAAGDFQCIARNTSDPSDTRVLLIMDGGFAMNINN